MELLLLKIEESSEVAIYVDDLIDTQYYTFCYSDESLPHKTHITIPSKIYTAFN